MKRPTELSAILLILLLGLATSTLAGRGDSDEKRDQDIMDVPIPVGHDASGIKLPVHGPDGRLQMNIAIEMARRINDRLLEMGRVRIETFDENGGRDLLVLMETSTFDLKTRVITSPARTVVRRGDFEITGETMRFDTASRQGQFRGFTRMLIFNQPQPASP